MSAIRKCFICSFQIPVFNAGLALAMHYQAKEIYCFGTDLGFKDEEYHHSKDSLIIQEI